MKSVQTELPDKLYEQVKNLVSGGWFNSESEVIAEAVRRFLEAHAPELIEQFVKEDVEWGLRGTD
jgi:Arc/MetJ-type ribon-helix-helix transcriptional regulator